MNYCNYCVYPEIAVNLNFDENNKERQSFQFVLLSTTEEENIKVSKNDSSKTNRYNYNRPNTTERKGLVRQ